MLFGLQKKSFQHGKTSIGKRVEVLHRFRQLLVEKQEELIAVICRKVGKQRKTRRVKLFGD